MYAPSLLTLRPRNSPCVIDVDALTQFGHCRFEAGGQSSLTAAVIGISALTRSERRPRILSTGSANSLQTHHPSCPSGGTISSKINELAPSIDEQYVVDYSLHWLDPSEPSLPSPVIHQSPIAPGYFWTKFQEIYHWNVIDNLVVPEPPRYECQKDRYER